MLAAIHLFFDAECVQTCGSNCDTNCRWCPVKEAPYVLREKEDDLKMAPDSLSKLTVDIMPIGTVREFKVSHDHAVH